jgi:hypothetical protein
MFVHGTKENRNNIFVNRVEIKYFGTFVSVAMQYFSIKCGSVGTEVRFIFVYKQKPKYFGWRNWMNCKTAVREGLIYIQASE